MTSVSRRTLMAGVSALAVLSTASRATESALSGDRATRALGVQLTTLTLLNTSVSNTVRSNSISPIFGHAFKKGDIPSGTAPEFRLNDGITVLDMSMSLNLTKWSDGSLKHAAFMLRIPNTGAGNAIPANGSVTIKIYSGGTIPIASTRSLSDFASGGMALNVTVTGDDGFASSPTLTGTWVSDLNQGIGAGLTDGYQFMDGKCGAVWRQRASFRQSGANHGQLEGYWYIASLNDTSNNIYGYRYMVKIAQPWIDVSTPNVSFRAFATVKTNDGASQLQDNWGTHGNTVASSYSGSGNSISATNSFEKCICVYLTGSVPTGVTTGTPYFVYSPTSSAYSLAIILWRATGSGGNIALSGGATSFTANPLAYVAKFSGIFCANTDGRMFYYQGPSGSSSASDGTILVQFNNPIFARPKWSPHIRRAA